MSVRVDSPAEAARLLSAHWALDGGGIVLAQPLPAEAALELAEFATALTQAEQQAAGAVVAAPP